MPKTYLNLICLLLFVLLSYLAGPYFPTFFTKIYNQILYKYLDTYLNIFSNLIPFSIGDVLYALICVTFIGRCIILMKDRKYKNFIVFIITIFLLFFSMFQIFWGWNNYKFSVIQQLHLRKGYTQQAIDSTTNNLIKIVNHQQLHITNDSLQKVIITKNLKLFNETARENYTNLPKHLKKILVNNDINNVKISMYSRLLSYSGFSGYFNPFTHENQINMEIPSIGMPITVAHEMAHQLGIASESEANFYGYMVMVQSQDIKFKYAANLYALKYCLKQYRNENEETYQLLLARLNVGVQKNIFETEQFWESKRNVSSFIFKHLYGRFLKINNQKDGIKSYNKFVDLLINYKLKYNESN